MAKESWGAKRTCAKCDARFYDLNKDPLLCPICGNSFSLESIMEVFKKAPKDTIVKKEANATEPSDNQAIAPEDIILSDDLDEGSGANVDIEDNLLEEEEEEDTPMDVIPDVGKEEDDN